MSRALAIAVCALVLVLPATVQKGGAQKGGGSTTSNLPVVNSLSPASKEAGMGSFVMTVSGLNFTSGSVVRWNGSNVSTGIVSSTQLNATIASSLIANVGTANVTVYTSGRKGGTSNSVTFTIMTPTTTTTTTSTAPAPSPTPLSITTSSLPGGTANTSFSSTVAATGGAPAYGWGLVNGGGSLPPGLTLQATGAISGTPTQSGTFTFTTQASDSASQIAQKVLSITVAADPNATTTTASTGGVILFQDDFETGKMEPPWDYHWYTSERHAIQSSIKHSGSNALQIYYFMDNRWPDHADDNEWMSKVIKPGVTDSFLRAYVYFKSPETGGTADIQRKIFWVSDDVCGYQCGNSWTGFLTSEGSGGTIALRWSMQGAAECALNQVSLYPSVPLNYNTWYSIELQTKLDTPGARDGEVNLWLDGVKTLHATGLTIRGNCTTPATFFSIGRQADRFGYVPVNEYRYFDDVVISTSYIGP